MNEVKAGYKTTEFYATLLSNVLGILTVTGVVTPDQSEVLSEGLMQVIGGVIMVVPTMMYIFSRGQAKKG